MTTLVDVRRQATVCDESIVRTIYTILALRLREIMHEINRHGQEFHQYTMKRHPVANRTMLITAEIAALEKLSGDFEIVKSHSRELNMHLKEFKSFIGTPFCNTAGQAHDLLANHVVGTMLQRVRRDLKMPEVTLQFSQLYTELVTLAAQLAR